MDVVWIIIGIAFVAALLLLAFTMELLNEMNKLD